MNKGDIILVPFPFTDLTGNKLRPALVLFETEEDVTVTFITTQLQWKNEADILLYASAETGLKKESLLRLSKLATLDKSIVLGKLGQIDDKTMRVLNLNLRKLFRLD